MPIKSRTTTIRRHKSLCWDTEETCCVFIIIDKERVQRIHTNRCRYNERLTTKTEGSKLLGKTGIFKLIRSVVTLTSMLTTLDLSWEKKAV